MDPINFILVMLAGANVLFVFIFFVTLVVRWRRSQILVDMDAVLADTSLRGYILEGKEREARWRYRWLTGASLRETRQRVRELIANPGLLATVKKKRPEVEPAQGEGVRTLIAEGRIEEAVEVYRNFMGVDKYTAEQAVSDLRREKRLNDVSMQDVYAAEIESSNRQQEKSRWE
jgi:hypothetical protein